MESGVTEKSAVKTVCAKRISSRLCSVFCKQDVLRSRKRRRNVSSEKKKISAFAFEFFLSLGLCKYASFTCFCFIF